MEITLQELLDQIKEKHGEIKDPSKVVLDISWEQHSCFGHDAYDPNDYGIVISTEVIEDKETKTLTWGPDRYGEDPNAKPPEKLHPLDVYKYDPKTGSNSHLISLNYMDSNTNPLK